MFLKFKPFLTSAVWEFKDPDTGRVHESKSREDLVRKIVSYRAQNNLDPIPELDKVIENYVCRLPRNEGSCKEATLERSFLQYVKGGVALLINMAFKNYVSQEKADERAAVCVKCPYNIFPDKKAFLQWSDDIAKASIGNRRSTHHAALGSCLKCSCTMKAKVWFGDKFDFTKEELDSFPDYCWQKKEQLSAEADSTKVKVGATNG